MVDYTSYDIQSVPLEMLENPMFPLANYYVDRDDDDHDDNVLDVSLSSVTWSVANVVITPLAWLMQVVGYLLETQIARNVKRRTYQNH